MEEKNEGKSPRASGILVRRIDGVSSKPDHVVTPIKRIFVDE